MQNFILITATMHEILCTLVKDFSPLYGEKFIIYNMHGVTD